MNRLDMDMAALMRDASSRFPDVPPAELEGRLVDELVELGRLRMAHAEPAVAEAPPADDLFHGDLGLPEIHGSELSAATLGAGILHHGALLVRQLYDPAQLARLGALAAEYREGNHTKHTLLLDTPKALLEIIQIYQDCGLTDAVRGYLGEAPVLMAQRAKLRQHLVERKPYGGGLGWHQDVAFFGRKSYAVNCWAAVSRCGDRSPGLEVIPRRVEELIGWNPADGAAPVSYGRALTDEDIELICGESSVASPVLEPGDAILFDEMTFHRTARVQGEGEFHDQLVTISWFFRPSGIPEHRTPIAV